MTLPLGISPSAFASALQKFREIVGNEWVFTSDEDLETYRDFYSPMLGEEGERRASAAIAPASTEEVQRIVVIANSLRIPIYPVSTGRNLGYGGSAPNVTGSVVIDLKRMNRILKVDVKRNFVLLEPGVSYFELYRHFQENRIPLMIDCPEPGWGSFVGNALERGLGYTTTAMRDHFGTHCGMEIVLPNGELLRTGMGASDSSDCWQGYRYGFGPEYDGLFSQGNFGIVTKMGFWLQPQPEAMLGADIHVPNYDDIVPLTDILTELENVGIVDGMPWFSSQVTGGLSAPPDQKIREVIGRKGGALKQELVDLANGRPFWTLRLRFFGPESISKAKWEHVRARVDKAIKGASFGNEAFYRFPLSVEEERAVKVFPDGDRRVNMGIPNLEIFALSSRSPINPQGSHGHIWLSPVLPRTGEAVMKMQNVINRSTLDLGIYVGTNAPMPLTHIPRSYLTLLPFLLSDDPVRNKIVREQFDRMIDICGEHGWFEYRAHPLFQDKIMNMYGFNKNALRRFGETLKDAVDPSGILAAGRYGLWPRHMRKA